MTQPTNDEINAYNQEQRVARQDAQKFDGGKPPLGLLSTVAMNEIAQVMAFGAQKYSAHQWRAGMDWQRLINAALRHITAYNDGEDLDPESGLSHLAHAGCCVMFLLEYTQTHPDFDNRYSPEEEHLGPKDENQDPVPEEVFDEVVDSVGTASVDMERVE